MLRVHSSKDQADSCSHRAALVLILLCPGKRESPRPLIMPPSRSIVLYRGYLEAVWIVSRYQFRQSLSRSLAAKRSVDRSTCVPISQPPCARANVPVGGARSCPALRPFYWPMRDPAALITQQRKKRGASELAIGACDKLGSIIKARRLRISFLFFSFSSYNFSSEIR